MHYLPRHQRAGSAPRARAEAAGGGLEGQYVEGDMRSLPWADPSLDCVVSCSRRLATTLMTRTGVCCGEAHRIRRPGGRLLIETNKLAELRPRRLPTVAVKRDGDFSIDQHRFDPTTGRALTERVIVRDGRAPLRVLRAHVCGAGVG